MKIFVLTIVYLNDAMCCIYNSAITSKRDQIQIDLRKEHIDIFNFFLTKLTKLITRYTLTLRTKRGTF